MCVNAMFKTILGLVVLHSITERVKLVFSNAQRYHVHFRQFSLKLFGREYILKLNASFIHYQMLGS